MKQFNDYNETKAITERPKYRQAATLPRSSRQKLRNIRDRTAITKSSKSLSISPRVNTRNSMPTITVLRATKTRGGRVFSVLPFRAMTAQITMLLPSANSRLISLPLRTATAAITGIGTRESSRAKPSEFFSRTGNGTSTA